MCLYSRLHKNPKYLPNKKNGGIIPPLPLNKKTGRPDTRVLYVPIRCGKCMECVKAKKSEYRVRLNEERKHNTLQPQFVTLTFSTEAITKLATSFKSKGYNLDNDIATKAVRLFTELWRKHDKNKKTIKHWLVTEIGGGRYEHIHLHGILWTNEKERIQKHWKHGYVFVGEYVNGRTITYITKYVTKQDPKHRHYTPIVLASKGIGKGYTESQQAKMHKFKEGATIEAYRTETGHRLAMPTYMRNKLYSDEEKEKLWVEKLNKQERWAYRDWETDRKSTRLNSSHSGESRMPSSA